MNTHRRRHRSRFLLPGALPPAAACGGTFLMALSIGYTILAGCASPGEPVERKAPVPQTVADLAAAQSGSEVILTFTVPKQGVNRLALKQTPSLEIYRGPESALPQSQIPA